MARVAGVFVAAALLLGGSLLALACSSAGARGVNAAADPIEVVADPEDQARVLNAVARARNRSRLGPAEVISDSQPIDSAIEVIKDGGSAPRAFQTAVQRAADQEGTTTRGWVFETSNLEQVSLPKPLLELDQVAVATLVVRRRAPGLAPHYTVCFMLVSDKLGSSLSLGGNTLDE